LPEGYVFLKVCLSSECAALIAMLKLALKKEFSKEKAHIQVYGLELVKNLQIFINKLF
jgi:hypothetical protein